jgi:hypothetical protein
VASSCGSDEAEKVLNLASESKLMLKGINSVFSESVNSWCTNNAHGFLFFVILEHDHGPKSPKFYKHVGGDESLRAIAMEVDIKDQDNEKEMVIDG